MANKMDKVTVGSRWQGSDRSEFVVRAIEVENDGTWVRYGRHAQDTTYSCLIDAFLHRFTQILN
jgi:hypothetical protein